MTGPAPEDPRGRCPRCHQRVAAGAEICECGFPLVLAASGDRTSVPGYGRRPLEPAGPDPAPPPLVEVVEEEDDDAFREAPPVDALVCEQCEQLNDRDRTWCSRCGHLLLPSMPAHDAPPADVADDRSGRRGRVLALVAALLLLGVAGVWLVTVVSDREPLPVTLTVTEVSASTTADASRDATGTEVTFDADHVVDGDLTTAWRAPGTVGHELVLQLDGTSQVTAVQLVPGYAKTDPVDGTDRFAENHTVTEVLWLFDGGASVVQQIAAPSRDWVQRTLPEPVTTSTVTLRITGTGNPDAPRDFTAVSEVRLLGLPTD